MQPKAALTSLETEERTKRSWWLVEFEVDKSQEDMASWLMIKEGANGCQFIDGNGGVSTLQASFETDKLDPDNLQSLYATLDEYGLNTLAASLRIKELKEEDWLSEWKKGLKPIEIGGKFLVSPPWFKKELESENSGKLIIWIEPGLAFGTGFHETTQFCLKAIEERLGSADAKVSRILDVGTGSGILAIAAAMMLPLAELSALETDPIACKIAAENFCLNQVAKQIKLIEGSTEKVLGHKYTALLSNLTCEDNIALLPEYAELAETSAIVIMSGILKDKLHLIEAELGKHPFRLLGRETSGIWSGLVLERI